MKSSSHQRCKSMTNSRDGCLRDFSFDMAAGSEAQSKRTHTKEFQVLSFIRYDYIKFGIAEILLLNIKDVIVARTLYSLSDIQKILGKKHPKVHIMNRKRNNICCLKIKYLYTRKTCSKTYISIDYISIDNSNDYIY